MEKECGALHKNFSIGAGGYISYQERSDSFHRFHYDQDTGLTTEMERAIYPLYDHIMVICDSDFNSMKEDIGEYRLLLCPHPAEPRYKKNPPNKDAPADDYYHSNISAAADRLENNIRFMLSQ